MAEDALSMVITFLVPDTPADIPDAATRRARGRCEGRWLPVLELCLLSAETQDIENG